MSEVSKIIEHPESEKVIITKKACQYTVYSLELYVKISWAWSKKEKIRNFN